MRNVLMTALAAIVLAALSVSMAQAHGSSGKLKTTNTISVQSRSDDDDDDNDEKVFQASLRGRNEVPAVRTRTKGVMTIRQDEDGDRLPFVLTVKRGNDVTMAHLHCAPKGQNGPIVVTLLGEIPGGFDIDGRLMKSAIEDDNINTIDGATCPTPISSVETLVTALENDEIYANVHTMKKPSGEIRGQLREASD